MTKDLDTQTRSRRSRRMRLTTVVGFVGSLGLAFGAPLTARADVIKPLRRRRQSAR